MTPDNKYPQLPSLPQGLEYRPRAIGKDLYVATGAFVTGAPDSTLPNLARVCCLVLDCDLADFLRPQDAAQKSQVKAYLHNLAQTDLDTHTQALLSFAAPLIASIAGDYPTACVLSGYGAHFYLWLPDSEGYSLDIPEARKLNAALVHALNRAAGFALADTQAHDAGTRILRTVGSVNTKNPTIPRTVSLLWCEPNRTFPLSRLRALQAPESLLFAPSATRPTSASSGAAFTGFASAEQRAESEARASARPTSQAHSFEPSELAELLATSEADATEALHILFRSCPFFLWAQDNAQTLSREAWRGAATNIAAIAGELGRKDFHAFSALDPARYEPSATDQMYSDALKSAQTHGPMTYVSLQAHGYPGGAPSGAKAPASIRFLGKTIALTNAQPSIAVNFKTGKIEKTAGNLRKLLRTDETYSTRLRFNEMRLTIEHDGASQTDAFFGAVGEYIEDAYKVAFPRATIEECVIEVAQENAYNPVRDYLQPLKWDGISRIATLVTDVLKANPLPLYVEYMRCFLISAVARALCTNPEGVKVDTALILKGEQGVGKSSFFRVLSDPFFCDTRMDLNSKDAFTTLRAAWVVEWQEFENALTRHAMSIVKGFLSAQLDTYRPVYARTTLRQPRQCVICGTTNEDHFLNDPTGSRRFWVIEVPTTADLTLLRQIKDQVWAEAVHLYKSGAKWHLDKELEDQRHEKASVYAQEDPWETLVCRWIEQKQIMETTTEQILTEVVQKEPKDLKRFDTQSVGAILRKYGFHRYRQQVNGVRAYVYRRTNATPEAASPFPMPEVKKASQTATNVVSLSEFAKAFRNIQG